MSPIPMASGPLLHPAMMVGTLIPLSPFSHREKGERMNLGDTPRPPPESRPVGTLDSLRDEVSGYFKGTLGKCKVMYET